MDRQSAASAKNRFQSGSVPWNKGFIGRHVHTPETRAKMSVSAKRRGPQACSPESRAKISASLRGNVPWNKGLRGARRPSFSVETRAKMSAAAKQRPASSYAWSPERRAKLSATNRRLGIKPPTVGNQKGLKRSPETIARIKAHHVRTRERRREKSQALWLDPAYREKMANAFRSTPSALELKMQALLDAAGVDYIFQYPVPGTRYVADFYLPRTNTLVEVDGARWHAMREAYDAARDATITALGYRIVRLAAAQVKPSVEFEALAA